MHKALNGEVEEEKPETVRAEEIYAPSSVAASSLLPSLEKASQA
jgi:DAACS family dicarboxylate/amino acid:cation (Na+ or H+) symporter/aerobic C4-dicarboxylate transport protein